MVLVHHPDPVPVQQHLVRDHVGSDTRYAHPHREGPVGLDGAPAGPAHRAPSEEFHGHHLADESVEVGSLAVAYGEVLEVGHVCHTPPCSDPAVSHTTGEGWDALGCPVIWKLLSCRPIFMYPSTLGTGFTYCLDMGCARYQPPSHLFRVCYTRGTCITHIQQIYTSHTPASKSGGGPGSGPADAGTSSCTTGGSLGCLRRGPGDSPRRPGSAGATSSSAGLRTCAASWAEANRAARFRILSSSSGPFANRAARILSWVSRSARLWALDSASIPSRRAL